MSVETEAPAVADRHVDDEVIRTESLTKLYPGGILAVDPVRFLVERGESRPALRRDDHPDDTAIVRVGTTLDVAVLGELVEVTYERRRLDAHTAGELTLAGAVGVQRLPQQHPVPQASALPREPVVEHVGDGALAKVQTATERWLHRSNH